MPVISVAVTVSATASAVAPVVDRYVVSVGKRLADIDAEAPPAPCDFDRSYRGTVGGTGTTLLLRPGTAQGQLIGLSHADSQLVAKKLHGSMSADGSFKLSEPRGVELVGSCDKNGALRGTSKRGKTSEPFVLSPRPGDWPALYRMRREEHGQRQQPNQAPTELCGALDQGYRVFGLGSAEVDDKVNAILADTGFEERTEAIKQCSDYVMSESAMSLVVATPELLVVIASAPSLTAAVTPSTAGAAARRSI